MPWCNAAKHSHAGGFVGQKGKMRLIYPPLTTITTPHTTTTAAAAHIQNKHALNSTNSPPRGKSLEPGDVTAAAEARLKRVITVIKVTRGDFNGWVYRHRATWSIGDCRKHEIRSINFWLAVWLIVFVSWFVNVRFQMVIYVYFTWFYYLWWSLKITWY